jgi:hypothetical protein
LGNRRDVGMDRGRLQHVVANQPSQRRQRSSRMTNSVSQGS